MLRCQGAKLLHMVPEALTNCFMKINGPKNHFLKFKQNLHVDYSLYNFMNFLQYRSVLKLFYENIYGC